MYRFYSCLGVVLLLGGCAPVAFMGASTSVFTSAAEERGLGGVISDTEIKARIVSLFAESDFSLNTDIRVVVRQGKVLLSGTVETVKEQLEAVRLAWLAKGVIEVHDEISVGQDEGVGVVASDSWISTQLKTKMTFDDQISSINYNLHTINGVVYIMGIAKTQQELDRVIDIARHISGVVKVKSYVTVSDSYDDNPVSSNYNHGSSYGAPAQNGAPSSSQNHRDSQANINDNSYGAGASGHASNTEAKGYRGSAFD